MPHILMGWIPLILVVNDFSFHKFLMLPFVEKISLAATDHEHQPVAIFNQHRSGKPTNRTMWGPPSHVCWFINPHNYSYLRTINIHKP